MNKLQLFRLLRNHRRLAEKRSAAYEQNRAAKVLIYIGGAFVLLYLMFIAVMLALIANDTESPYTPYEFIFGLAPFFLTADFLFRFIAQQTPSQLIKPYSLLPIPKYTCVELFVLSGAVSPTNLIWTSLTIPYAIMTTLFSEGAVAALGVVVAFQLLVAANSLWYMLARTLINQSLKWWLLPAVLYSLVYLPLYAEDIEFFFNTYTSAGAGLALWNPIHYLCVILVLAALFEVNKRLQYRLTYTENAGGETTQMKTVSDFAMLNRYGETGEYLKLEIKSLMRNKNVKKTFIFSTVAIMVLSLAISLTDIYDSAVYKAFWIVYTFVLYGAVSLIKIMSAEGNYIDCLITHKENIMQLLKAKYYFYSALLVFPLLLMLPTVFTGKYSLLMLLSMMSFTIGPVYCLLMQMAVYNKQAIPLNTKFVSKGSIENNYFQVAAELVAMFCPMIIISVANSFFSENTTCIILLVVGMAFIASHRLWIRNIYSRFMKRRYENTEGFRATR